MNSSAQNHALSICYLILCGLKVGDDEHLNRVASFGLAKSCPAESILAERRQTCSLQKQDAVRVGVRIAVCKVDVITFVSELKSP